MCGHLHVIHVDDSLPSLATCRSTCQFILVNVLTSARSVLAVSQISRQCGVTALQSTSVMLATAVRHVAKNFCICRRHGPTGCSTRVLSHIVVMSAASYSLTDPAGCVIAASTAMLTPSSRPSSARTAGKLYWSRESTSFTSRNKSSLTNHWYRQQTIMQKN